MKAKTFLMAALMVVALCSCEKKEVEEPFNLTNASWITYEGTESIGLKLYYDYTIYTFLPNGKLKVYGVSADGEGIEYAKNGQCTYINKEYRTYSCSYPNMSIFDKLGGNTTTCTFISHTEFEESVFIGKMNYTKMDCIYKPARYWPYFYDEKE